MKKIDIVSQVFVVVLIICALFVLELAFRADATDQLKTKAGAQVVESFSPTPRQGETLGYLLNGGLGSTLNVLYMGNSRIARPTGFAFDGLEEVAFDAGRLAGNAFTIPLKGYAQNDFDNHFLINTGNSMTSTPVAWRDSDSVTLSHSVANHPGLFLIPGRIMKMGNFKNDVVMLPRTETLEATVQYLAGPGRGTFKFTPVEVNGDKTVVRSSPSTTIDTNSATTEVKFTKITMPVMVDPNLNRSFRLQGVTGTSTVMRVSAQRDVANGISLSEMAVSGKNYIEQSTLTNPTSWTTYVQAFNPDIVFWQYAGNNITNNKVQQMIDATKLLMDRVEALNPEVLHIVTIDHPTPRSNYQTIVSQSIQWANALNGYHDALVVDPTPFLPQDFLALAGTGQLGIYFGDIIHENIVGAGVVFDATWQALQGL